MIPALPTVKATSDGNILPSCSTPLCDKCQKWRLMIQEKQENKESSNRGGADIDNGRNNDKTSESSNNINNNIKNKNEDNENEGMYDSDETETDVDEDQNEKALFEAMKSHCLSMIGADNGPEDGSHSTKQQGRNNNSTPPQAADTDNRYNMNNNKNDSSNIIPLHVTSSSPHQPYSQILAADTLSNQKQVGPKAEYLPLDQSQIDAILYHGGKFGVTYPIQTTFKVTFSCSEDGDVKAETSSSMKVDSKNQQFCLASSSHEKFGKSHRKAKIYDIENRNILVGFKKKRIRNYYDDYDDDSSNDDDYHTSKIQNSFVSSHGSNDPQADRKVKQDMEDLTRALITFGRKRPNICCSEMCQKCKERADKIYKNRKVTGSINTSVIVREILSSKKQKKGENVKAVMENNPYSDAIKSEFKNSIIIPNQNNNSTLNEETNGQNNNPTDNKNDEENNKINQQTPKYRYLPLDRVHIVAILNHGGPFGVKFPIPTSLCHRSVKTCLQAAVPKISATKKADKRTSCDNYYSTD